MPRPGHRARSRAAKRHVDAAAAAAAASSSPCPPTPTPTPIRFLLSAVHIFVLLLGLGTAIDAAERGEFAAIYLSWPAVVTYVVVVVVWLVPRLTQQ